MQELSNILFITLSITIFLSAIKQLRVFIGYSSIIAFSTILSFYISQHLKHNNFLIKNYFIMCLAFFVLGNILSFLLEFIPSNMRIVDAFRGTQYSEQFAPELGNRDSYLETYSTILIIAIFFESNFFLKSLETLLNIFIVSLESESIVSLFKIENLIALVGYYLEFSIKFIFPLILFSIIIELSISFIQKMNPKMQLGHELTIAKNMIAFLFIFISIKFYENQVDRIFYYYQKIINFL